MCKRLLEYVCRFNLAVMMRHLTDVGTPPNLQSHTAESLGVHIPPLAQTLPCAETLLASVRPDLSIYAAEIYRFNVEVTKEYYPKQYHFLPQAARMIALRIAKRQKRGFI